MAVVSGHDGPTGSWQYKQGALEYLVRIPRGWSAEKGHADPNSMPVVFFHGLGFGLLQSHLLIRDLLSKLPTHPIVIPIAPHTSQSVFHERFLQPWTKDEVVSGMKDICKKWGFWDGRRTGGISLLSHSNGSIAHAWCEPMGSSTRRAHCSVKDFPGYDQAQHICRPRLLLPVGGRHMSRVLLPQAQDCKCRSVGLRPFTTGLIVGS